MIPDITVGGVLLPALLVLAIFSLVGTITVLRLLAISGFVRQSEFQPLIEIATFTLLYGLLIQFLPAIGILS